MVCKCILNKYYISGGMRELWQESIGRVTVYSEQKEPRESFILILQLCLIQNNDFSTATSIKDASHV